MIPNLMKMLLVGPILLIIGPGSVIATYPTGTPNSCTVSTLTPCGSGCIDTVAGQSCCSDATSTFACSPASAETNQVDTTITSSRTSYYTETATLESSKATPEGEAVPTNAFGLGDGTEDSVPPGYPTPGVPIAPTSSFGPGCEPSTVTVTVTEHHTVTATCDGSSSTASTISSTGTETLVTSVPVTSPVSSSPTTQTASQSSDVAPTSPNPPAAPPPVTPSSPPTTTSPTTSPGQPSQPSQPISSYTPGNGGLEATVPSIFALYMVLMGMAFI